MGLLLGLAPQANVQAMTSEPALMLAGATVLVVLAVVAWILLRQRQLDAALADFAQRYRLTSVDDPEEIHELHDAVAELFGLGPKVTERLKHQTRGFDVYVERMKIPLYRVDLGGEWDERLQESAMRLIVLVRGFETELPDFRLMPNSWTLNTVRGKKSNIFNGVMPFGHRNYVLARDRRRVMHLFGGELQRLLRQNRDLIIDGRGRYLAFYLQGDAQPRDIAAFTERAVEIAEVLRERAARLDEPAVAAA